eukprot:65504-Prymnesium_polylepis.1
MVLKVRERRPCSRSSSARCSCASRSASAFSSALQRAQLQYSRTASVARGSHSARLRSSLASASVSLSNEISHEARRRWSTRSFELPAKLCDLRTDRGGTFAFPLPARGVAPTPWAGPLTVVRPGQGDVPVDLLVAAESAAATGSSAAGSGR